MTEAYELALMLVEHELGRSFRIGEATETVRINASFAPLQKRPIVAVKSVKARKLNWEHSSVFGSLPLVDIPLSDIENTPTGVILPQTLWGSYDEATITYLHGLDSVPHEIDEIVQMLIPRIEALGQGFNVYSARILFQDDAISALLESAKRG